MFDSAGEDPYMLAVYGNKLYFETYDDDYGRELWATDGTINGTSMVKDILVGEDSKPYNGIVYNNKLYFTAMSKESSQEIWVMDSPLSEPRQFTNLSSEQSGNKSLVQSITVYNNKLYYVVFSSVISANDAALELWRTDGTEAGTEMLKNKLVFDEESSPVMYGNKYIYTFVANSSIVSGSYNAWVKDIELDVNNDLGSTKYNVTFKDYNGTILKTVTVNKGSSATAPTNPTRKGYTFNGWDKSYSNVTSNLTITAKYSINVFIK